MAQQSIPIILAVKDVGVCVFACGLVVLVLPIEVSKSNHSSKAGGQQMMIAVVGALTHGSGLDQADVRQSEELFVL